jgi:hypothetical protein
VPVGVEPPSAGENVHPAPDGAAQNVHPVVGGLEAHADDPETAEPIEPHRLVGERNARGSAENPG